MFRLSCLEWHDLFTKIMGYNLTEKRCDDVTNTKFVKLWDRLVYPKRTSQEKNVLQLPKISLFVHLAGDISIIFR